MLKERGRDIKKRGFAPLKLPRYSST